MRSSSTRALFSSFFRSKSVYSRAENRGVSLILIYQVGKDLISQRRYYRNRYKVYFIANFFFTLYVQTYRRISGKFYLLSNPSNILKLGIVWVVSMLKRWVRSSVSDPFHLDTDPRICFVEKRILILFQNRP